MRPSRTAGPLLRAVTLAALTALLPLQAPASPERAAAHFDAALKAFDKNDYPAASIHLKNALQEDSKMLAAHMMLGRILVGVGEFKAAEASLEEALRLGVSKLEVAPLLGQVYLQLGEPRKVLETFPVTGVPPGQLAAILTLRGQAHGMMGSMREAADAFAEAKRADPKAAQPYIAEAPMLLRAGERDKARAAVLKGTELAPSNGFAWFQQGTVLHALGDLNGALTAFDKAVALTPKHADSHVSRALLLLAMGRRADAEKTLQMLKAEKVTEPRASWMRGMLAREAGDANTARTEFSEAVNLIDPMAPAVRNGNEALLLAGALSHHALGNREKVREYLDALLSRNSRHFAGQMLLASVLMESQDYTRAQPLLENLARSAPENLEVQYMLGSLYLARKQYAQAAEFLERASRKGANPAAVRELSFSQFGMGQNKVALANLERVFAANPKDLRAGVELAVVYARSGQGPKAVQVAETLIKQEPGNLAMLNFLGNVKGRLGDRKGQREAYQKALAADPKFRQVVLNISWLDMDEGRLDDARARLQAHVKDNPKDPDALLQLGIVEQRTRRPAEALAAWKQADEAQNKDPRPGLATVELLLGTRQVEAATAAVKSLVGRYPGVLPVLLMQARVLGQAGDRNGARAVLQEATKIAGFEPGALVDIARLQLQVGNPDGAAHAVAKAQQAGDDGPGLMALQVDIAARRGAAAEVDKALAALQAKHPAHVLTHATAGHVAMSRGQYAKAVSSYRAALEKEPSTPIAIILGQALLASNDMGGALAHLERWHKRNPSDLLALRALAELQLQAGKSEAAKQSFAQVVAADPGDAQAMAAYARALHLLKDPAALATAEKAYKLAPQQTQLADMYGWMLVQQGQLEPGIRVLREARLRDPAFGPLRWHLAAALTQAGRKTEAKEELLSASTANLPAPADIDAARLRADLGL